MRQFRNVPRNCSYAVLQRLDEAASCRRVAKLRKKRTDLGRVSVHELTDRNGGLAADRSIICFSGFPDDGTPTCASVVSPERLLTSLELLSLIYCMGAGRAER